MNPANITEIKFCFCTETDELSTFNDRNRKYIRMPLFHLLQFLMETSYQGPLWPNSWWDVGVLCSNANYIKGEVSRKQISNPLLELQQSTKRVISNQSPFSVRTCSLLDCRLEGPRSGSRFERPVAVGSCAHLHDRYKLPSLRYRILSGTEAFIGQTVPPSHA